MSIDLGAVLETLGERSRERGNDVQVALMTLVVFFEDEAIGELARDRIHTLASKHPSRVIVLDGTRDPTGARVEAGDWIELGATGCSAETLRSAIAALRLPEAPLVLLWIAPGIGDDPRFAMLSEHVQTVVYNSSLLDSGHEALCELVDYVEHHPRLPLADIAYLRLAPWQESVAIFFDGKDVEQLYDLRYVEIACGSEPEGFYLLGWLASRLHWRPCSERALLTRQGRQIEFEIRRAGEPRRISCVALSSSRSKFVAEVDKNAETIQLSVTGSSRHPQRYRAITNPGIAALLERAILWGQNDRIFHDSLNAAGEILAHGKG
ncbi:MAG: glucose-6-phosphate dehydrogenase assembly protein OpcA [Candidatus Eremiobacteraeota bacterium]|nr:glucose-6-phosphate dehydrogenase assembly protein OpcA [Candidatus Eremiobacteraeota bacterium]MBV8499485.1 glucose-6-phosphate dehydrogenase assembly protein OpcA [Candidatus Eremiobacteraeota bacterium]